jgi:hypothetical protein
VEGGLEERGAEVAVVVLVHAFQCTPEC